MTTQAPSTFRGRKESGWSSALAGTRDAVARSSIDARLTAAAVLFSLGLTIWWLTQDTRVPDYDSAKHTRFSFFVHDDIVHGEIFRPFTEFNNYPPLGHLIGALGTFVGGLHTGSVILALAFVFLPVLAAACYGVGRQLAGPRAGLLAALFALGTPMIVSESHEAYLDPLQTAMVALSVLAIIASRRFARTRMALLAGVITALAFMTKETTPIFLAGLLAVVLARGGWRNWRGMLLFALPILVIAAPWYLDHVVQVKTVARAANSTAVKGIIGATTPPRYSAYGLGWYFWDATALQLWAPLTLLAIVGTLAGIRSSLRDRSPQNIYPELLGGALVSFVGITLVLLKDPRYSLPALIYLAVLGTAWIPKLTPRLVPFLTAAVVLVACASVAGVAFGLGGHDYKLRIALPGAYPEKPPGDRFITVYSTMGWILGPPESGDGEVLAMLRGLRREGVRKINFCCTEKSPPGSVIGGANRPDFNTIGLDVMSREAGLKFTRDQTELRPTDVFLVARPPIADAPPCQRFRDGTALYAVLGNPIGKPFSRYTFICPGRKPAVYGYAPQSVSLPRVSLRRAS
jgi:hypothetical protein